VAHKNKHGRTGKQGQFLEDCKTYQAASDPTLRAPRQVAINYHEIIRAERRAYRDEFPEII
jgi:hypothetical protein